MTIILFRHMAKSLAEIFTSEFSNDIGLKLNVVVGSFPGLGNVMMYALSISRGKESLVAAVERWGVGGLGGF